MKSYLAVLMICLAGFKNYAATRIWSGAVNTSWTTASNWAGNNIPGNGDNVEIPGGLVNYPVITTTVNTKNILVNSTGTGGRITISSGTLNCSRVTIASSGLVTITGGSLVPSQFTSNGTLAISNGTLASSGDIEILAGGVINQSGGLIHLNSNSAQAPNRSLLVNAGGVINQTGGTIFTRDLLPGSGTFNQNGVSALFKVDRNWQMGAGSTFNATSGTVQFLGTANQANFAAGMVQFSNIIINAGVNPGFSTVTGSILYVNGNFTNSNTALANTANVTIIFNGSSNQTISSASTGINATFGNLEVNKPSGTLTLLTSILVSGNLTVSNGVFDMKTLLANRSAAGGTFSIGTTGTLLIAGNNGGQAGSNFPLNFSTVNILSTGTVIYNGVNQTIATFNYGNLILQSGAGAAVKTMNATPLSISGDFSLSNGLGTSVVLSATSSILVSGSLNIGAGTTLTGNNFNHTVGGNISCTGTYNAGLGKITLNGTAVQNLNCSSSFFKMEINKATGNVVLLNNTTVNDSLIFIKGVIHTGIYQVRAVSPGKIFGASQSTGWVNGVIRMNVATGASITLNAPVGDATNFTPASLQLNSVTIAGMVNVNTVSGDHPLLNTSLLNSIRSVNRYWNFVNQGVAFINGIFTLNWVASDIDAGCDPLTFKVATYGPSWDTAAVVNVSAASIQATGITGFKQLAVGEICNVSEVGTWTGMVSNVVNNSENWKCGLLPGELNNIIIPASAPFQPVLNTGVLTVHNVTILPGAQFQVSGASLEVAGTIVNNGVFDVTTGTVIFNGTSQQTIAPGTFASGTINNLVVNNAAGVTLAGMLSLKGSIKAQAGNFNSGGLLTLLSDATQTALVDGSGAGEITGMVTMQRYLPSKYGYKYFSSPFQSSTVSEFTNEIELDADFPTFYKYDENKISSGWTNYTDPAGVLIPLNGYAANFGNGGAPGIVDISGILNNHTQTIPLWNHNQPYTTGFNLVGNPYPSPVDWDEVAGWNRSNIDDAIYYFDASGSDPYGGTYSTYINGISSNGIAGNIIPSMQAFFVHVSDGTYPVSASLEINNSARATGLQPYFHRDQSDDRPSIRLEAGFSEALTGDALVVYFDPAATPAFDRETDAIKLFNTDETTPDFFSLSQEGSRLAINSHGNLVSSISIPLGLQVKKPGVHTIRLSQLFMVPDNFRVYLCDDAKRINRDLRAFPEYSIDLPAGMHYSRFRLQITQSFLPPMYDNDEFGIYSSGETIYLYVNTENNSQGELFLTGMDGRQVLTGKYSNGQYHLKPGLSDGIYVASFYTGKQFFSKKIFIGQ